MFIKMVLLGMMLVSKPLGASASVVYVSDKGFMIDEENDAGIVFLANPEYPMFFAVSRRGAWAIHGGTSVMPHQVVAGNEFPSDLSFGVILDVNSDWPDVSSRARLLATNDGEGNFFDSEGFLGVRMFVDDPLPHYGWIRMSHSAEDSVLTVHDWAWNSVPGEPILAGEIPEPKVYALLLGIGALVFVAGRRFRRREAGVREPRG